MTLKIIFSYILGFPFYACGFGIEIEGLIDLGPKWNYEYKFSPISYEETTVKTQHVSKFFNNLQDMFRKENEFENEKVQKSKISELHETKTKSASSLENQSSDQFKTYKRGEKTFTKVYEFGINKENENIEKFKLTVGSENNNPPNKLKYQSTQFTFNIQVNDENNPKELRTKVEENSRDHEIIANNVGTSGLLDAKNKYYQKKHKNKVRGQVPTNITDRDHKVKDDSKIFGFTLHIFNQNLKIFDNIMKAVQLDRIKRKFKSLKKSYIEQFKNFLSENKNYKIKTVLGNQKVILNTIDTSNKILQKLVHQLSESMDGENFVRSNPIKIFQRNVDRQKVIEDIHACKKFRVCRNREEYSDFITEIINTIIQANDSKVKQAADALTEVTKTTDFTKAIDNDNQSKLRKFMKNIEVSDTYLIKGMFLILRNAIRNKNHPIVVMDPVDEKLAAKTTAFHNLIDILNKNIIKSANSTEWEEIKRRFVEWKDGFQADILNLFETLIKQIKTKLDKMDSNTTKQVNENMKILFKPLSSSDKFARLGTRNPYHEIL